MKVEIGFYGRAGGGSHGSVSYSLGRHHKRSASTNSGVSYVQCCTEGTDSLEVDGSEIDLCSMTESEHDKYVAANPLYNKASCQWHWDQSSASGNCDAPTITFSGNDYSPLCSISTSCGEISGSTSISAKVWDAVDLHACRSGLRVGACSDYGCGDRYCTVGDCQWHWDRSRAATTCIAASMSLSHSSSSTPNCSFTGGCKGPDPFAGHNRPIMYWHRDYTFPVWDVDDLLNCNGVAEVDDGTCDVNGWLLLLEDMTVN